MREFRKVLRSFEPRPPLQLVARFARTEAALQHCRGERHRKVSDTRRVSAIWRNKMAVSEQVTAQTRNAARSALYLRGINAEISRAN